MNRRAHLADRALQMIADALIGLLFYADRKHCEWANLTDDEVSS